MTHSITKDARMISTHTVNLSLSKAYVEHGVTPSLNGAVIAVHGLSGLKVGSGYIASTIRCHDGARLAYVEVLINGVLYAGSIVWDKPSQWARVTKIESMHFVNPSLDI